MAGESGAATRRRGRGEDGGGGDLTSPHLTSPHASSRASSCGGPPTRAPPPKLRTCQRTHKRTHLRRSTSDATMCVGNEPIAFLANFNERPKGCSLKISGAKGPKLSRLVMPQRLFDNNPNLLVDRKGLSPIVSHLRRRLRWSRWLSGLIILNTEVISGFGDRL